MATAGTWIETAEVHASLPEDRKDNLVILLKLEFQMARLSFIRNQATEQNRAFLANIALHHALRRRLAIPQRRLY